MKLLLPIILALCAYTPICQAQTAGPDDAAISKINPAGRLMIMNFKSGRTLHAPQLPGSEQTFSPYDAGAQAEPSVSVIVSFGEGGSAKDLEGLDVRVLSEADGMAIVSCPLLTAEKIAALPQVRKISFGDLMQPMMNFARPSGNVTAVQSGFTYDGNTLSFDGTGVVCGMMDTGLEANHINFRNEDGSSRIKRLWHMTSNSGVSTEYTDQTIRQFTSDDPEATHATHVAGIIGGGYKGNGKFAYSSSATATSTSIRDNEPIPFYGVSTGADLAFAVGQLYSPNILTGVENIIDYAESTGQPCVVNLSLGQTYGPHDGTDAYTQYLSRLGKRAIICMSSGNDGDAPISITKTLTATGNGAYLRTIPVSSTRNNNVENGMYTTGYTNGIVDLWTDSSKPVKFAWKVFTGDVSSAETIIELSAPGTVSTAGNTSFSRKFSGEIEMTASVDTDNNRYNVYSRVAAQRLSTYTAGVLILEVTGESGTKLYLYGSSVGFTNSNGSSTPVAFTKGSASNSINDGCCGDNVISVGAYTSRTSWGCLNGNSYSYNGHGSMDAIAPFSSYGTTYQGKALPLVCGPGSAIVSSYSRYYDKLTTNTMTASVTSDGVTDYWGAMQGTSMSCPYVTGTIGLWLQADPTLDFDKVMEVIDNTSSFNALTMRPAARWGAGKIDALAGIKYVLQHKAAIGEVWADPDQRFILTATADGYEAFIAGATGVRVNVYDLQGRLVTDASADHDSATVATSQLTPGVYILEATAADGQRFTRKITR